MQTKRGYRVAPFSLERRMVVASATVGRERNNIHAFTEVDISQPWRQMREHKARTGESLSLTAYVVTCLARAIAENRSLNALRSGRKIYLLDEVIISVLVERTIHDQQIPDMLAIHAADTQSFRQIHDRVRTAQRQEARGLGELSGMDWLLRLIPPSLFTLFVRLASRSPRMALNYGVVGVTAVGMFGPGPMWMLPLSGATIALAIGGIVERPILIDGGVQAREHLCLTLSFDHDLIDGAPAARFTARLAELLRSGELLRAEAD